MEKSPILISCSFEWVEMAQEGGFIVLLAHLGRSPYVESSV